jgi:hypothetical protein
MNWRQLHENLWCADEPFVTKGLHLGARMTVVRLQNGELILISPLHFSSEAQQKLAQLGEVKYLISPNKFHFLDLVEYSKAYPQALVYFPPGLKIKDLEPHAFLSDEPENAWRNEMDQTIFRGNSLFQEVVFFHRASRTLILTDLCFNLQRRDFLGKLLGFHRFGPSLLERVTTRRRTLARASLRHILQWDFDRIVVAHGEIVERGGRQMLERAFAWLL